MQNHVEQSLTNPNAAVVINKAEFAETVHEEAALDCGVPIIFARLSSVISGIKLSDSCDSPNFAINRSIFAKHFSLELKSWSTRSDWMRIPRARRN